MQRSGKAPLFVCLDLQYVGDARHCQVIRDCLPRIKGFCIHGSGLFVKKLGSCHMEYITSRSKIRTLLRPVDDESTGVMVVSSHC